MALLAIPFSLSTGRRSTLTGAAGAVGIAAAYILMPTCLNSWET